MLAFLAGSGAAAASAAAAATPSVSPDAGGVPGAPANAFASQLASALAGAGGGSAAAAVDPSAASAASAAADGTADKSSGAAPESALARQLAQLLAALSAPADARPGGDQEAHLGDAAAPDDDHAAAGVPIDPASALAIPVPAPVPDALSGHLPAFSAIEPVPEEPGTEVPGSEEAGTGAARASALPLGNSGGSLAPAGAAAADLPAAPTPETEPAPAPAPGDRPAASVARGAAAAPDGAASPTTAPAGAASTVPAAASDPSAARAAAHAPGEPPSDGPTPAAASRRDTAPDIAAADPRSHAAQDALAVARPAAAPPAAQTFTTPASSAAAPPPLAGDASAPSVPRGASNLEPQHADAAVQAHAAFDAAETPATSSPGTDHDDGDAGTSDHGRGFSRADADTPASPSRGALPADDAGRSDPRALAAALPLTSLRTVEALGGFARAGAPVTTADVPAADTADHLVQSMRMQFLRGGGDAIVHIRPEHLGPVTISLRVEDGAVAARIVTDNPAVAEWLQSNEHALRDGLKGSGLQLERLVVHRDGQSPGHGREREAAARKPPQRRPANGASTFEITV